MLIFSTADTMENFGQLCSDRGNARVLVNPSSFNRNKRPQLPASSMVQESKFVVDVGVSNKDL